MDSVTNLVIAVISLVVGITSSYFAIKKQLEDKQRRVLEDYAACAKREVNSERDFNHLRRNYEQMNVALNALSEQIEQYERELDHRLDSIDLILNRIELNMKKV